MNNTIGNTNMTLGQIGLLLVGTTIVVSVTDKVLGAAIKGVCGFIRNRKEAKALAD